jgi:glycosyltransferase involved in cell wall biosynthesis
MYRKKVVFLFKHYMGHHLVFALPYMQYYKEKGFQIDVICPPASLHYLKQQDYYDYISVIHEQKMSKVGFFNLPLFSFIKKSTYDLIVMPTADEWFFEILCSNTLKYHSNVKGILHYVSKSPDKLYQKLFYRLNEAVFDFIKFKVDFYPLTLYIRDKYKIEKEVLPYFPNLINNKESLYNDNKTILIFGAIREDKFIHDVLISLADYEGVPFKLLIVGHAKDKFYVTKLENLIENLNRRISVTLKDQFISEQDKGRYISKSSLLLVPNSGSEFSGKMISGVLLDALVYDKHIMLSDDFAATFKGNDFFYQFSKETIKNDINDFFNRSNHNDKIAAMNEYKKTIQKKFKLYLEGNF